jgi:hypothetical protein
MAAGFLGTVMLSWTAIGSAQSPAPAAVHAPPQASAPAKHPMGKEFEGTSKRGAAVPKAGLVGPQGSPELKTGAAVPKAGLVGPQGNPELKTGAAVPKAGLVGPQDNPEVAKRGAPAPTGHVVPKDTPDASQQGAAGNGKDRAGSQKPKPANGVIDKDRDGAKPTSSDAPVNKGRGGGSKL